MTLEQQLEGAALRHLDRYDCSVAGFRATLQRRARRIAERAGQEPDDLLAFLERLLERYQSSGLLDDLRYASNLAQSLRRRGMSRRAVEHRLRGRRVPASAIALALEAADSDRPDAELDAARAYVARRRIGPHRPAEARETYRRRDFAALARAGFNMETARTVLNGEVPDGEF